MVIDEEFEVAFKDNDCEIQKELLKNAIHDLKNNIYEYNFVTKKDKNDQTLKFIEDNGISRYDIKCLLDDFDYSEDDLRCYGDILKDRKFKNNYLYILYFDNAIVGNWDYRNSDEKLLYIKWNPLNKNIISFHTMRKIHKTNRDKLKENLSYNQIIDRVFYTGDDNWHLKKFYDLRKKYNGKDVSNVKLIATEIDDEGYCDILFGVQATKDGTLKKELVGDNGQMIDNISDEYMVTIRINDFWDMIEEFGLERPNDFTKADVVALIQLSEDIKIKSSDPSFWWQGLSYWLSLDNASLMPCNIAPKFWDKYRPNVKVSKIIESVLRQFGFFTQQIAMSIKKALIEQGYIERLR